MLKLLRLQSAGANTRAQLLCACRASDVCQSERVCSGLLASTSCDTSQQQAEPSSSICAGWSDHSKAAAAKRMPGKPRAAAVGAVSWPTDAIGQVVGASSAYVRVELAAWEDPSARVAEDGSLHAATSTYHPSLEYAPTRQLLCNIRALLFKLRQTVLVGDFVRVRSIDWTASRGVVGEVLPRVSELTDPSVANVGHLLLVFALDSPPFEEVQVSRFLVSAEAAGLPFSLCLNKADLVAPEELQARVEQCRLWGYEPLVMSCESGEGVAQVAHALQGRTSVVAGPSGAGKSSLINTLRLGRHRPDLAPLDLLLPTFGTTGGATASTPGSSQIGAFDLQTDMPTIPAAALGYGSEASRQKAGLDSPAAAGNDDASTACVDDDSESAGEEEEELEWLAVGSVSKIGRGKHTTTTVRLIKLLGGGMLADTPGFGQPSLDRVESSSLWSCFPEIVTAVEAQPCRFSDCMHIAEPGCSVREVGFERYPLYLRCLEEIREREEFDTKVLQAGKRAREGNAKMKAARGGTTRMEARLDVRRHRTTSRRAAKQGLVAELAEQDGDGQLQM